MKRFSGPMTINVNSKDEREMRTRTFISVALVLGVLLTPCTARARYMSPDTGRFQTMDSYEGDKSSPQSLHKYQYAENDPVNRLDPSGNISYIEQMVVIGAVSLMAAELAYLGVEGARENGGRGWSAIHPDPNSPHLTANHHAVRIRNATKSLDDMFDRLRNLNVPSSIAQPFGFLPVTGVGERIGWDMPFFEDLGQADFYVNSVKYSDNPSGTGPQDHFFAVETLKGHPLKGWRFWRVHKVDNDTVVETGAVDEPNGKLGRLKASAGGNDAIMRLWDGLLNDALIYSGGHAVSPDGAYDFPHGHWVPERKQEFMNLVQ
jgi:RHS repeat-associated protein